MSMIMKISLRFDILELLMIDSMLDTPIAGLCLLSGLAGLSSISEVLIWPT